MIEIKASGLSFTAIFAVADQSSKAVIAYNGLLYICDYVRNVVEDVVSAVFDQSARHPCAVLPVSESPFLIFLWPSVLTVFDPSRRTVVFQVSHNLGVERNDIVSFSLMSHDANRTLYVIHSAKKGTNLLELTPDGLRLERSPFPAPSDLHSLVFSGGGGLFTGRRVRDDSDALYLDIYRSIDGARLRHLQPRNGYTTCLAASPLNACFARGASDGTVTLYSWAGDELHVFEGHTFAVLCARFSPDGRFLFTAAEGCVRVWDVAKGAGRVLSESTTRRVLALELLPDGRRLAVLHKGSLDKLTLGYIDVAYMNACGILSLSLSLRVAFSLSLSSFWTVFSPQSVDLRTLLFLGTRSF